MDGGDESQVLVHRWAGRVLSAAWGSQHQRITEHARRGFAAEQPMTDEVHWADERPVSLGYTARLI